MALKIDFITGAVNKIKQAFTDGANNSTTLKEGGSVGLLQSAADKIGTAVAASINALASIWTKFTTAVTDGVNASNGLKEGGSIFDTQIAGVQDDGSIEGVVRTKLVSGELVHVPAIKINWFNAGSETTGVLRNATSNSMGSWSGLAMPTPTAFTRNTVARFTFYGRILGIQPKYAAYFRNASVIIDGRAYKVSSPITSYTYTERDSLFIIATDLPDGLHHAFIGLNYSPDSSVSNTIHGIIVEKRAGYRESPKLDYCYNNGLLTTTQTSLTLTMGGNDEPVYGLRRIKYRNEDTVARVVTVYYNNVIIDTFNLAISGTTGDTATFDCGESGWAIGSGGGSLGIQHKADVASKVRYFLIEKSA